MFETILETALSDTSGMLIQIFFAYTIVLMIVDKQKPPLQTCILTGLALMVLSLGGSYHSPITAGLNFINGGLWLTLAYQRYRQRVPAKGQAT